MIILCNQASLKNTLDANGIDTFDNYTDSAVIKCYHSLQERRSSELFYNDIDWVSRNNQKK